MKNNIKPLLIGINSKYIHPAMGVFSIVANSKIKTDYQEFQIHDDINKIINAITLDYNLVCFSTYIWNIEVIRKIIPHIKNKYVMLGGPEASFNPSLINTLNFSIPKENVFIIKGEGEQAFNELIDYLNQKINIENVSNLYYFKDNTIKYTFTSLCDLNIIKHDLSLIKDYTNRICYLESSRGCYYHCTYCLASTEKPVRFFPLKEIQKNLLFLLDNKAKVVKFLDRSFNCNPEYANNLLKFIKEHDNNYTTFQFEINGDSLNTETINIINSMRYKMIRFEIGIQSTNTKTNKTIRRIQNFDKLKANIELIKNNTIIHTDLIAGLPYEGYESFQKSFNDTFLLFTEELQLGILKELKGTVISETKELYEYNFSDTAPFEVISNKFITKEELDKIRLVEKACDRFYNYGYYKKTIQYLFNDLKLNPFLTLLDIMTYITSIKPLKDYQFDELTKAFYNCLIAKVKDKNQLLFILKQDYLTKNKIKPKIWWDYSITRTERLKIYQSFATKFNLSIDNLYKHGYLEKNNNYYFLVVYNQNTETYYLTVK